jgi:hypothetical protein
MSLMLRGRPLGRRCAGAVSPCILRETTSMYNIAGMPSQRQYLRGQSFSGVSMPLIKQDHGCVFKAQEQGL